MRKGSVVNGERAKPKAGGVAKFSGDVTSCDGLIAARRKPSGLTATSVVTGGLASYPSPSPGPREAEEIKDPENFATPKAGNGGGGEVGKVVYGSMARWLVQTFDSRIRPGYDGGEVGKVLVLLIQWRFRLKVWLDAARRRLGDWLRVILARVEQTPQPSFPLRTEPLPVLKSYEKLILTDGVSQTLFKGYAQHRESARGEDETGWILMGHRHEDHGLALAAIPAGVNCEAGVAHVRFNSQAQSVASMILRQDDRKLNMLGVVHTHPGSLRHPSRGDLHGDREWIGYLRGQEGVFGIGTADGEETQDGLVLSQPSPSTQCYLGLRYSWYCLGRGDRNYRALPVQLTIGPDLAEPLHKVWSAIESHAKAIERLYRTLKRIRFQVETEAAGNALLIRIPFDEDKEIRVALSAKEPSYLVCLSEQWLTCDPGESAVDQCVFSILEKLAQL